MAALPLITGIARASCRIGGLGSSKQDNASNTPLKITNGRSIIINFNGSNSYRMKRNRFCGFPIGVRLDPMFAAKVCNIIIKDAYLSIPQTERTANEIGTSAINATSLVINIDIKKQEKTRKKVKIRKLPSFDDSFMEATVISPSHSIPFKAIIRLSKHSKVLKSIYCMYAASGGTMNIVINARMTAAVRTGSLRINNFIFKMANTPVFKV